MTASSPLAPILWKSRISSEGSSAIISREMIPALDRIHQERL